MSFYDVGRHSSRTSDLSQRIEVDKDKIEVIEKLPSLTNIKGVRSFLGYTGFYRRFIKDFSKIAKPLSNLLARDVPFNFDDECLHAFDSSHSCCT